MRFRLSDQASGFLLTLDVIVLWLAISGARDTLAPTWARLLALALAIIALLLAVRTTHILLGEWRRRRA